ncbi:MAG: hypothetical protein HC916_20930 [Coleofasciculaceae cyanobacterium SM2_1_6]|nr:hypothetical protein [Coleofasciculaceae cyanobacterium SM2_1_6]
MLLLQSQKVLRLPSLRILAISLGVHSLILFLPYGNRPHKAASPQPQKVRISTISPAPQKNSVDSELSSYPPQSPTTPIPTPTAKNISSPVSSPVTPSSLPRTTPISQPSPQELPIEDSLSVSTPEVVSDNPRIDSFDDFPKYPNTQPGSFDLLPADQNQVSQQTIDDLSKVSLYFEQSLPAYKYQFQLVIQEDQRKVYQVSKGGLVKYLTLIFQPNRGTIILLANVPINLSNLNTATIADQLQISFEQVLVELKNLGASRIDIPEFYFTQPEAFYSPSVHDPNTYDIQKPRSGFDGNFILILKQTPEQLFDSFFNPRLSSKGFTLTNAGTYGGGNSLRS